MKLNCDFFAIRICLMEMYVADWTTAIQEFGRIRNIFSGDPDVFSVFCKWSKLSSIHFFAPPPPNTCLVCTLTQWMPDCCCIAFVLYSTPPHKRTTLLAASFSTRRLENLALWAPLDPHPLRQQVRSVASDGLLSLAALLHPQAQA